MTATINAEAVLTLLAGYRVVLVERRWKSGGWSEAEPRVGVLKRTPSGIVLEDDPEGLSVWPVDPSTVVAVTVALGDARPKPTLAPRPKDYAAAEFREVVGSKGDKYTLTVFPDGEVRCTCPGFTYRGKCRHASEVTS